MAAAPRTRALGETRPAAVAVVALCAAQSASADIIAAVDVPLAAGPGSSVSDHPDQFDVALLNATTGARFSLPAGVNTTTADEFHPSLTPDGKWLAFERVDPSAGTTRIIEANLTTGQVADLFNTFEISTTQPATPFVEPDGSTVVTGTPYSFHPQWTSASLSAFPGGPFTHTQIQFSISEPDGRTLDPVDAGSVLGVTVVESSTGSEGVVLQAQRPGGRVRMAALPFVIEVAGNLEIVRDAVFEFCAGEPAIERLVRLLSGPVERLLDLFFVLAIDVCRIESDEGLVVSLCRSGQNNQKHETPAVDTRHAASAQS